MKRILAVVLAMVLAFSALATMPVMAYATGTTIAQKTSTAVDETGRFKVEIQVPGEDGREYHDEVIVMVDGSYSTDDDWSITRSAIVEIGKTMLEDSGNTLLTVMTFGMGDNIVLKHVASVAELEATLTELPGGLLYGRSSTNCEAGFTGIAEYIGSHDGTLNEVHVVYITDGEINTDETKYAFYNWTENTWLKEDAVTLARWAIDEEYAAYESGNANLSNAYLSVFGIPGDNSLEEVTEEEVTNEPEWFDDAVSAEGIFSADDSLIAEDVWNGEVYSDEVTPSEEVGSDVEELSEDISDEEAMAWAANVWADVYAYSGMTPENAYTVSDAERAFVKYDKENGTHVQEMFYYALWGRSYPDRLTRTPAAGLALAANEKVAHLYMVDSNSATSWMSEMAYAASNVSFYEAGSVSNLLTALEGVLTNLTYTPYNDVIVTDYMSKWVNLDTTTVKVVDNNAGATIWTSNDGWLISENRPTSQEVPVVVTEVSSDAYTEGGANVVGNENGTIYKLTWYVKDGAMLRNHNYSLVYEVDVDTQETGFEYDTDYPANGNTTIDYTEIDGDEITEVTEDIPVPDVIADGPETIVVNGTKIWNDEDDKYGKRPDSITINLMADGIKVESKVVTAEDNWSYSFGNVIKYNAEGKEIVYTVSEDKVANYETKVDGYNITNTYVKPEPETIDIIGTKAWMDEGDKYGKRPDSITINLMADGTKVESKVVTAEDNWSYSFKNVAKYDAEGNEIIYTVSEDKVAGYETKIEGYNIVNTFVKPETIDVVGTKTWEDENDKYGKRPDSITVHLRANGKFAGSKEVTAEDNWKYSFEDVPKYDLEGKEISYTVSEDKVANYETKVDGYNITNTYVKPESETIDVSGTKTWKDNNDRYGKRPDSITVNLKADGKKVASKVVTEKDDWKYSFNNLPKYNANGKKIVYTVTENRVANYKTKINGYDIVNTYKRTIFNNDDNPRTGDYIYVPVAIAIISGSLLIFMFYLHKKNKNKK